MGIPLGSVIQHCQLLSAPNFLSVTSIPAFFNLSIVKSILSTSKQKCFMGEELIIFSLELKNSKKLLLETLENHIDQWKETYNLAIEDFYLKVLRKDMPQVKESEIARVFRDVIDLEKSKRREKYAPQKHHWDNYDLNLKVYDLKTNEGLSWAKIVKELKLNNVQTARNRFKAAKKLIKNDISIP